MNIVIGCDHAGFMIKNAVVEHIKKKAYIKILLIIFLCLLKMKGACMDIT